MADSPDTADTGKKSGGIKVLLAVGVLLVLEAVLIVGAMSLLGGPKDVNAELPMIDPMLVEQQKTIEVPVLDAKLPNATSGVSYLFPTEIFAQVRQKHSAAVVEEIERFSNEIKADIGAIWRTGEPQHFQEPKLETLTRKVHALLDERFGTDEETGDPVLQKVVIVMGTGFRVDR